MKRWVVHELTDSRRAPMNLVYGLIDPRTRLLRYIGKSSAGTARPKQHEYSAKSSKGPDTYCRNWIRELQRLQLRYEIVVLDVIHDATELDEWECWWIAYGWACGWPLTNILDGGVPTAETLAKIRDRQKRKIERAAQAAVERQRRAEEKQRFRAEYEAASAARIRNGLLIAHGPEYVAAMDARKKELGQSKRSPAEIERACFELFEKHKDSRRMFIEVVIGARVTPNTAHWLYEKWLTAADRTPEEMAVDHEALRNRLARERMGEGL